MQVSISSITIPPRTPGDLHQNFAPTLHPSFFPGGGGFVGIASEGRAFVYLQYGIPTRKKALKWSGMRNERNTDSSHLNFQKEDLGVRLLQYHS